MSKVADLQHRIIAEAMACVDDPYMANIWGPNKFDCVGFVGYTGLEAEALTVERSDPVIIEAKKYSQVPNSAMMHDGLNKFLYRVYNKKSLILADITLIKFFDPLIGRYVARHLGIVTKIHGSLIYIVHAS